MIHPLPIEAVMLELVVVNHRGHAALRPAERRLRKLANGRLGVMLGKEVRQIELVSLPGKNFVVGFVDHRLPPRAEAASWATAADWSDLAAEMAKGVRALPPPLARQLHLKTAG